MSTMQKFLQDVRNEKYGPYEKSSLPYARIKERTIVIDEPYEYGISGETW